MTPPLHSFIEKLPSYEDDVKEGMLVVHWGLAPDGLKNVAYVIQEQDLDKYLSSRDNFHKNTSRALKDANAKYLITAYIAPGMRIDFMRHNL